MKKTLFLILATILFGSFLEAEEAINECMSDIYFANGINTTQEDAKFQLDYIIEPQVMKLLDPRVRGIFITPSLIALHEV